MSQPSSSRPGGGAVGQGPGVRNVKQLGRPSTIFYGWTALVLFAGAGYFSVKQRNAEKRRAYDERERRRAAEGGERREPGSRRGGHADRLS